MKINICNLIEKLNKVLLEQKYMLDNKKEEKAFYTKLIYLFLKNTNCYENFHFCYTARCEGESDLGLIVPEVINYCDIRPCLPLCLKENPQTFLN